MNIYKKLAAILSVALISGLGIFGISNAVGAQTQRDDSKQEDKRQEKRDRDENKDGTKENESREKQDGNSEDSDIDEQEETEVDEQAEQAGLVGQATVSRDLARGVALQNVPGEVVKIELEDEDGSVVWGFEIRRPDGAIADVKVDAKTGNFVKAETNSDDESGETDEDGETENG